MSLSTRFVFLFLVLAVAPSALSQTTRPTRAVADGSRFAERVYFDADRYVLRLDRIVGLTRRQEARIYDLLVGRTFRTVQRRGPRATYPFPRFAAERSRAGRVFWSRTDERIAQVLTRRQRRAYARFLHERGGWYSFEYQREGWRGDDRWQDRRRSGDRRDDRRRSRGW
ncbi:MAG: hypothetical protein AAGG50_09990 [Bacteroidota bacterium]